MPEPVALLQLAPCARRRPRRRRRWPSPARSPVSRVDDPRRRCRRRRRRRSVTQPSARIGRPIGDRPPEVDRSRAVTPQLSSPTSDQAMTSSRIVAEIPPWAIPSQPSKRSVERQLGPATARGSTWRTQLEAVLVERRRRRSSCGARTRTGAAVGPARAARRPQTSRFWTFRASVLMKSLRGATFSPMSIVKISSASRGVLDVDPQERPRLRVHRRLPELVGVHLAEALEALDRRGS